MRFTPTPISKSDTQHINKDEILCGSCLLVRLVECQAAGFQGLPQRIKLIDTFDSVLLLLPDLEK